MAGSTLVALTKKVVLSWYENSDMCIAHPKKDLDIDAGMGSNSSNQASMNSPVERNVHLNKASDTIDVEGVVGRTDADETEEEREKIILKPSMPYEAPLVQSQIGTSHDPVTDVRGYSPPPVPIGYTTRYPDLPLCFDSTTQAHNRKVDSVLQKELSQCSWFYRAWTLQELLSPRVIEFYDSGWTFIGTKYELAPILSAITNVPVKVLDHDYDIRDLSVAERMAWASKRKATRVEDEAYSLLGIFDVNMPMLYGEGPRAFRRLQEEIIKQSNDHTIFVWNISSDDHMPTPPRYDLYEHSQNRNISTVSLDSSMFAPNPSAFTNDWTYDELSLSARPFSITNNGIHITLTLQPWTNGVLLGLLDCLLLPKLDQHSEQQNIDPYQAYDGRSYPNRSNYGSSDDASDEDLPNRAVKASPGSVAPGSF